MSLDAIGNIGELLGSIGVLVSLFYLAIQVKKNTETERTSTYQAVVSDFGGLNRVMAASPDLSYLFVEGMEDFERMQPADKARLAQVFYLCFRYFENMYYQHRKGYMEEEVWIGWRRLMLTYFARPGMQSWWSLRRGVFSESFAVFLESEQLDQPLVSYHELTHSGLPARAVEVAPGVTG